MVGFPQVLKNMWKRKRNTVFILKQFFLPFPHVPSILLFKFMLLETVYAPCQIFLGLEGDKKVNVVSKYQNQQKILLFLFRAFLLLLVDHFITFCNYVPSLRYCT